MDSVRNRKYAVNRCSVERNMQRYITEEFSKELLAILDADDGKTFSEKKMSLMDYLRKCRDEPIANVCTGSKMEEEETDRKLQFWKCGECLDAGNGILMRNVQDVDREGYYRVQRAYSVVKDTLKNPEFFQMIWKEHTKSECLPVSILIKGEYVGYCAINDLNQKPMEIGIELLPEWTGQGIGFAAVSTLINEVHQRLGECTFCARIDPRNEASQCLFEKLGAVLDGVVPLWKGFQKVVERAEEENVEQIDGYLKKTAEKFGVPPKKLLSHVLKYKLNVEDN